MHYYKRNLGDYAKKAGRLSMLQHGSYTLLTDACYDREQFPTLDQAIEWTWASTTEEVEAVKFVLSRFFTLSDGVYIQKRIKEEMFEYHEKAETNRRIALEREAARKANATLRGAKSTKREPVVDESSQKTDEPPPNHKPITNNQEPVLKNTAPDGDLPLFAPTPKPVKKTAKVDAEAMPLLIGVSPSLLADYLVVRGNNTLTVTAVKGLIREAASAGISLSDAIQVAAESGWRSFKADWYAKRPTNSRPTTGKHSGFKQMDYRKGVNEDGTFD